MRTGVAKTARMLPALLVSMFLQRSPPDLHTLTAPATAAVNACHLPGHCPPPLAYGPDGELLTEDLLLMPEESALGFEHELNDPDHVSYSQGITDIAKSPANIGLLLSLARFMSSRGLGREAWAVIVRAFECLPYPGNGHISPGDLGRMFLLLHKTSVAHMSDYRLTTVLSSAAALSQREADGLYLVGRCYHRLRDLGIAEALYMGCLLLNPCHPDALRGYALLLFERGFCALALKMLNRIAPGARCYGRARLEVCWVLDILADKRRCGEHIGSAPGKNASSSISLFKDPTASAAAAAAADPSAVSDALVDLVGGDENVVYAYQKVVAMNLRDPC